MKYLLDTDICIYLINHRPAKVEQRFRKHDPKEIALSSISLFELETGVLKSQRIDQNKKALAAFSRSLALLDFTPEAAWHAANIRASLEKKGTPIGSYDVLIAGLALAENLSVVTNNIREFSRVDGLRFENWAS